MAMIWIIIVFCFLYTVTGIIRTTLKRHDLAPDPEEKPGKKQYKEGRQAKLIQFFYWKIVDLIRFIKYGRKFSEFGLTMYCGRQGAGKTISMVRYLEEMRVKYPNCLIGTNFQYVGQDFEIQGWEDLIEIRNGENGVIFAFDEMQNEWDSAKWSQFPDGILRQITMQRKQRIKIVATSQVYTRVVKALREQCFEVVECYTLFGRWTFCKCYDAEDYNTVIDDPEKKRKLYKKWKLSFIQTDEFRKLYDTDLVVEKIKNLEPGAKQELRRLEKIIGN